MRNGVGGCPVVLSGQFEAEIGNSAGTCSDLCAVIVFASR